MSLTDTLKQILINTPGKTTRELVSRLRERGYQSVDRNAVNVILYCKRDIFRNDSDYKPRWFVNPNLKKVGASVSMSRVRPKPAKLKSLLYAWQQEALDQWKNNKYCGVVEAVTGAGKTEVGLTAVAEELKRGGKVLVLVPTIELLSQWSQKIQTRFPKSRLGKLCSGSKPSFRNFDVIVAVINSARDWDLDPFSAKALLIADECHCYGSACNQKALDERFNRRLGLSATYRRNDNGNEDWLDPYFGGTCFELDYKRAIKDNVVAHFSVALIGVSFDVEDQAKYEEYSEKAKRLKNKLVNTYGVDREPFGEFFKQVSSISKGGHQEATIIARKYLKAFSDRRKLLAETDAKGTGLEKLSFSIRTANRVIVFTQTIEGAEYAADILNNLGISAEPIHSDMQMDERKEVLSRFEKGALKVIVAPKVLDEGVDVPEADFAIIIATSHTRRQMIQRMGRVLRRKKDGRLARFALLFVENTSEDPESGTHEEFIDDVIEVANDLKRFRSNAPAHKICKYLNKITSSMPVGAPRMAK